MITNVLSTGEQYFKAIKANKIIKILKYKSSASTREYNFFLLRMPLVTVNNFH